jgi:adenine-specific DNA-methyltransferase
MSIDKIKTGDDLTQSLDIVSDNISKLKELFPEVLTEGKIDFKVLQDILGNEIEEDEEFYRFTWAGKSQSRREAHKPSTGTLRPCKEESVDWDTTQNLYIEGDNLEVLKLLQKSYSNKVKMIYIDPPYNTGKDFVYKDNYKDNLKNYQQITGQVDDEGNKRTTNSESEGRYHSNWLNMMYPRLRLSRNLLKQDGIIFISIDDNEIDNLRKLCNEVFGEDNFIAQIMIVVNPGGRDYNQIAVTHEYLLVYQKSEDVELLEIDKDIIFKSQDSLGGYEFRELRNRNPKFHSGNRPNLFYPFYVNPNLMDKDGYCCVSLEKNSDYFVEVKPYNSKGEESVWRWGKTKSKENIKIGDLDGSQVLSKQKKDGNWNVYEKNRRQTTKVKSIWDETEMRTENGTRLVRELFGETVFDHPKPVALIERICQISGDEGIFLDFFSGSSSSAHGILNQNIRDNGSRRYIMVQLPELVSNDSIAYKNGFQTICDIAKERIRLSGNKIKKENPLYSGNMDIGFKVFKLDSSNIKGWDGLPDNLEKSLFDSQDNIKSDRKEEDVLFEILLKYGLDLTLPIEEKVIEGKKVFNVGFGALFICLGNELTSKVAEGIGQWKETLKPETCRVIFKDGGFTDVEKTNSVQTLKRFGIQEIKSI